MQLRIYSSHKEDWDEIYVVSENTSTGNFTLQYSPDNGSTWTNISTTIAPSSNSINWTVPNIQSKDVLLRIYHNTLSFGDTNTATFHIMDQPVINLTTCQNSIKLS